MATGLYKIYVEKTSPQVSVLRGGIHEYEVQQKWLRNITSAKEWQTEEGHRVRILSPGYHNLYGGPDFKDALLEINGLSFRGDIEIHPKAGDWYQHGHHKDIRYDRVLLHIVLYKERNFTTAITSKGHAIPTLVLPHFYRDKQNDDTENALHTGHIPSLKIPPCLEQIQFDYEVFIRVLAQQRVLNRVEQMRYRFREVSLDELIYEFLFYGLGMGTKYAPLYLKLAQYIPYSQAKEQLKEDPRILESVLLHTIGYLQKGVNLKNPYALVLENIRKQYGQDYSSINLIQEDNTYVISSVYPNANPALRIAYMVSFLSKIEGSLSEFLYSLAHRCMQINSPVMLWERVFYAHHYYWSYYNNWEMKRNQTPHALIGRKRMYSLLGNILFPFFIFSIQEGLWGQREERIWDMYYRLPGENNHWLLKRMKTHAEFLFCQKPLKFFEQQALIQWYKTGCSIHPRC
ncbi:MAG: DUF2851 family protein, partial [Candidatus Hydrogenedens sp.]